MGMDVMGNNPTTKEGEYFRNNVWWWRPLWNYCCDVAETIIDDETAEYGHYNDGRGLDAEGATALGMLLLSEIQSGRTADFKAKYDEECASVPMEPCKQCNATGIRTDEVGIQGGWHDKELSTEIAIVVGRTHGSCNGCAGYGKCSPWESRYPFAIENVEEFARFCMGSGGFSIC